jgi:hypothetical protein
MPPRTRKTAASKPAAAKPKPAPLPDGVLRLDRAENDAVIAAMIADREPLFAIGDAVYTIPRKVPPSWSLRAFNLATTQGETAALAFAAEKLLEPEAWTALQACETLTPADMTTVLNALVDRIMPDGAFPKASPPSGTND